MLRFGGCGGAKISRSRKLGDLEANIMFRYGVGR